MRKTKLGQEVIAGLNEAIAHVRGEKKLRTTTVAVPEPAKPWSKEQIVQLRKGTFGVSQPIFAGLLSVTTSTVRAWEQGQKSPSGAARRLLEVAAMAPEVFERLTDDTLGASGYAMSSWPTHSLAADRPSIRFKRLAALGGTGPAYRPGRRRR